MKNLRAYLLSLATLVALAASYYFVVALPAHNRENSNWKENVWRLNRGKGKEKRKVKAASRSAWLRRTERGAELIKNGLAKPYGGETKPVW
jgi:hypothetical protein